MGVPSEVFRRSLELFQRGCLPEAEALTREGLVEWPEDGHLWQLLGLLRVRAGDHAEASEALETASLLRPLDAYARCALADCHVRLGREEPARQLYRFLAEDPGCPTGLLPAVASGLGGLREDAAALDVCRELARRDASRHEAYFGMAFYLRRLGHPATSLIPWVALARELAPRILLYRVLLASLLATTGEAQEAYELIRDVPPESIRCSGCLRRMMAVFRLAGDDARAEDCRRQADGDDARALPGPEGGHEPYW